MADEPVGTEEGTSEAAVGREFANSVAAAGEAAGLATSRLDQLKGALSLVAESSTSAASTIFNSAKSLGASFLASAADIAVVKGVSAATDMLGKTIKAVDDAGGYTKATADEIERISGMSILALEKSQGAFSRNLAKNTFETINSLGQMSVKTAEGIDLVKSEAIGKAPDLLKIYTEALINDTDLYKAASEGLTGELALSTAVAQKNLGLNASELNLIFEKELSKTGEISGKALKSFEKALLATHDATGFSAEKIKTDMIAMMSDFNTYGDITETRAASLSATITKLGISVSDVTSMVGKFQTFDAATQAMSNLSAMTGATLDTMELFRLANEDQEAFVLSLREQLDAQGVEFDQMDAIQKRQLASAFGLDARAFERMMGDNLDLITSQRDEIEKGAKAIDDKAVDAQIASFKSVKDAANATAAAVVAGQTAATVATLDLAKNVETGLRTNLNLTNAVVNELGNVREAAIKRQQEYRDTLNDVIAQQERILNQLKQIRAEREKLDMKSGGAAAAGTSTAEAPVAKEYKDTPSVQRMERSGQVSFTEGDFYAAALNPADLVKQVEAAFPDATRRIVNTPTPVAAASPVPELLPSDYLISGLTNKTNSPAPAAPRIESPPAPTQRVEHVIKFVVSGDGSDLGDALARSIGRQLATSGILIEGISTKFKTDNPQLEGAATYDL